MGWAYCPPTISRRAQAFPLPAPTELLFRPGGLTLVEMAAEEDRCGRHTHHHRTGPQGGADGKSCQVRAPLHWEQSFRSLWLQVEMRKRCSNQPGLASAPQWVLLQAAGIAALGASPTKAGWWV